MNRNQKKELVPIIALLLFIAVVLILCAVSAGKKRREASAESAQAGWETVSAESGGMAEGTAEAPQAQETAAAQSGPEAGAQISGNMVKKTNQEMLAEMADYWSRENVAAVEDLGRLAHYRRMSASLQGPAYFYYYGDRNEENRPHGTGIAVYGGDQYYYGSWSDGKRSGQGMWLKLYFPEEKKPAAASGTATETASASESAMETTLDPALRSHSYRGAWADSLPNGEGHEQYAIDMKLAKEGKRYFQNVIGGFQDGLYDGSMYIITVESGGNTREWDASASRGVFETFPGRDQEGRVPMGRDRKDADSHMWISALHNREQGIREVREQVFRK